MWDLYERVHAEGGRAIDLTGMGRRDSAMDDHVGRAGKSSSLSPIGRCETGQCSVSETKPVDLHRLQQWMFDVMSVAEGVEAASGRAGSVLAPGVSAVGRRRHRTFFGDELGRATRGLRWHVCASPGRLSTGRLSDDAPVGGTQKCLMLGRMSMCGARPSPHYSLEAFGADYCDFVEERAPAGFRCSLASALSVGARMG